jgi:hypothetical protein
MDLKRKLMNQTKVKDKAVKDLVNKMAGAGNEK